MPSGSAAVVGMTQPSRDAAACAGGAGGGVGGPQADAAARAQGEAQEELLERGDDRRGAAVEWQGDGVVSGPLGG
eukprot:5793075-Prymnesium_polylepis.1